MLIRVSLRFLGSWTYLVHLSVTSLASYGGVYLLFIPPFDFAYNAVKLRVELIEEEVTNTAQRVSLLDYSRPFICMRGG